MKTPPICPFCRADLRPHCPAPNNELANAHGCSWHRCRICGVVVELQARRGWTRDNQKITFWPRPIDPEGLGAE